MLLHKQNTGIIVQARLGSTRLPGKVLLPFYDGESILGILFKKLHENEKGFKVVLATGNSGSNDPLLHWAKNRDYICFRGSENNVLNRFIKCASAFGFEYIIRVCADNPFLNTGLINEMIEIVNNSFTTDYMSYCNSDGIPAIKTHFGFFSELISTKGLQVAEERSNNPSDMEHVSPYLYNHPDQFSIRLLEMPEFLRFRKDVRLTIDSKSDFRLAQQIYSKLNGTYDWKEIVKRIDENPTILKQMETNITSNSK